MWSIWLISLDCVWFPHLMDKVACPRVFLSTESAKKQFRDFMLGGSVKHKLEEITAQSPLRCILSAKQQQKQQQLSHRCTITNLHRVVWGIQNMTWLYPICHTTDLTPKMAKKSTHHKPYCQLFSLLPNSTCLWGQQADCSHTFRVKLALHMKSNN